MQDKPLKEKAYHELRKAILNREFRTGEFLTERTLVEKLGMSRTPIRAALERLEVEGHVSYTPNKGIFITELSIERVIHFFDFRVAVESHVVRKLAGQKLPEAEVQWFRDSLEQQRACVETNDSAQFTVHDSEFHRRLAQVYGNTEIVQTMDRLQDRLFQIGLSVLQKDPARIMTSCEDHARIFALIEAGEAEAAVGKMVDHLEFGKRILLF
ncbi:MAG: GntR family transcriptional regulator [Paenibacillaceae bacterium]|jgi:DNA-binding GntR family transcriptional regulator|nr:GntR family transcriptional regulator [Paenibacillaceae bacterium]